MWEILVFAKYNNKTTISIYFLYCLEKKLYPFAIVTAIAEKHLEIDQMIK